MQVPTGKGTVNLMAVIAIWALSLSVNLPGLAVSPMLSDLTHIFPKATQIEVQLITILPNLVIIPFVLLSGRLSRSRHKIALIVVGLSMYILSAGLYFLCSSMLGMILVSCLLGIGCGLFLPFSTGLVADVFTGQYRMHQMGIVSGVGNIAVVVATYAVGWLAAVNWHLPFLVYCLPLISLALLPFLRTLPKDDIQDNGDTPADMDTPDKCLQVPAVDAMGFPTAGQKVRWGFYIGRTAWLCILYFSWILTIEVVTYYMPFLMSHYDMSVEQTGMITAIFFLSMFVFGVAIPYVLKVLRGWTFVCAAGVMGLGCLLFIITSHVWLFVIASACMGISLGISQPIIYDKATEICVRPASSTMALAVVLSVNYLGIVLCPFVIDGLRAIFSPKAGSLIYDIFPFLIALAFILVLLTCTLVRRKGFIFGITKAYY